MDHDKPIQLIQRCPMCDAEYKASGLRVVRETEAGTLLYFKCSKCFGGLIATIVDAPFGLLGSGLVTDLQFHEVEKYSHDESVTEDDVIEMHRILAHRSVSGKI